MPITTNEAKDFKAAYMLAFDNVSTDPSEVKMLDGVNLRYARTILKTLTDAGLLSKTEVEGSDVWQTPFSPDTTDREDAEAVIDEWITEQTKDEPKPAATATPAKEPKPCRCGCGDLVPSKSFYRPGHDARHAGVIGRLAATMDGDDRAVTLAEMPSPALVAKAEAIMNKAIEKAEAKQNREDAKAAKAEATRAEPTTEDGTVKVGKHTWPATRFVDTDEVVYFTDDAREKPIQASKTAAKTFKVAE